MHRQKDARKAKKSRRGGKARRRDQADHAHRRAAEPGAGVPPAPKQHFVFKIPPRTQVVDWRIRTEDRGYGWIGTDRAEFDDD